MNRKLDTDNEVYFYEQEFYILSNFSAFSLMWRGLRFDTSEAAYHWEKFPHLPQLQEEIRLAPSAHDALLIARNHQNEQRADWNDVKIGIMYKILQDKVAQHPYVRRKLLETGTRTLIEDSWPRSAWHHLSTCWRHHRI
jgi:ribA/ribD-fused uncharacterized protein